MRIATWNLERPKARGWKRNPRLISKLQEINADIWILTETQSSITIPGFKFKASKHYANEESCATIWSRYPIVKPYETFSEHVAVCAEIATPIGHCLVYGTIITYAHDGTKQGAKLWERHLQSIEHHAADWQKLRQLNLPLIVAGDFNEALHAPYHYGTKDGRTKLLTALADSELTAITAQAPIGYAIDHICVSPEWQSRIQPLTAQNQFPSATPDKSLSDHSGLYIDIH